LWWNTIGTLPKTLGLLLLGYYFANALTRINSAFDFIASVTVVLGLMIIFVWIRWYQKRAEPELK
jgi:membrane protein DedA with SNARE-associated domain